MSKFLRKSRPCWDMTIVVKASCSCWICEEGISKRKVIRRQRGRVCAIFGFLISSLFFPFAFWSEGRKSNYWMEKRRSMVAVPSCHWHVARDVRFLYYIMSQMPM